MAEHGHGLGLAGESLGEGWILGDIGHKDFAGIAA